MGVPPGRRRRTLTRGHMAIGLAMIIANGCGGGGERVSSTLTTPTATPSLGVAGTTVTFSLVEFSITPSAVVLPSGVPFMFVARNDGTIPHSMSVRTTDVHLFTALANPRDSQSTTGVLPSGTYRFICPVDNHAKLGMVATVTVLK
jgi:uncharacterized cupredoxin-like copper-binding protein